MFKCILRGAADDRLSLPCVTAQPITINSRRYVRPGGLWSSTSSQDSKQPEIECSCVVVSFG